MHEPVPKNGSYWENTILNLGQGENIGDSTIFTSIKGPKCWILLTRAIDMEIVTDY